MGPSPSHDRPFRSGVDLDQARHELNAVAGIRDPPCSSAVGRLANGLLAVPLKTM
jgi:hypothetical protein